MAGKGCFTINSFSGYSATQDKKRQSTDTKKPVPAIMKIFRQSGCVLECLFVPGDLFHPTPLFE